VDNLMSTSYSEGLAAQGLEVPQAARVCALHARARRGGSLRGERFLQRVFTVHFPAPPRSVEVGRTPAFQNVEACQIGLGARVPFVQAAVFL